MKLHHVMVAMPYGAEDLARSFYAEILGMTEVEKPPLLAIQGGCWFRSYDGDSVVAEIHMGTEADFSPAMIAHMIAHPGLIVDSTADLEELAANIQAAGFSLTWEERHSFDGYERFHCRDPFDNRVEIMTPCAQ